MGSWHHSAWALWVLSGVAAPVMFAACGLVAGLGDFEDAASTSATSSGAGGQGGGTGGTGVTGGGGGGPNCTEDNCSGPVGECSAQTCVADVCTLFNETPGTDCPSGVCDGLGTCVECVEEEDCVAAGDLCIANTCVSEGCGNNLKDSSETDIDCGGVCPPCDVGKGCVNNGDCTTGVCGAGDPLSCVAATSCDDLHSVMQSLPDGAYVIDPSGGGGATPFWAYCNMTYDGGGWTLVMKLSSAGSFLFGHTGWQDNSVLHETDLQPNTTTPGSSAKYHAYNSVEGGELSLQWLAPVKQWHHDMTGTMTARTVFSGNFVLKAGDPNTNLCQQELFSGHADHMPNTMRHGKGRQVYGLNADHHPTSQMRWGFGSDNDADMPYKSHHAMGTDTLELKWEPQASCTACDCYGTTVSISPTSANLWIR